MKTTKKFAGLLKKNGKAIGHFLLIKKIESMEEFCHEMKFGESIYYKDKVYSVAFMLGFSFRTITEGIANGLFHSVEKVVGHQKSRTPSLVSSENHWSHELGLWISLACTFFLIGYFVHAISKG